MSARANEPYAQLTWRITQALREGDLTLDQYGVLTYLVATVSHEHWAKPASEQVLVTELAVIKAEITWSKSSERLRQVLQSLADAGWIVATPRGGSSPKWEIGLARAAVVAAKTGAQDLEQSSKSSKPETSAKPLHETADDSSFAPNATASLEVDVDLEVDVEKCQEQVLSKEDTQATIEESSRGPARPRETDDLATLTPDVRRYVEKARATQSAITACPVADCDCGARSLVEHEASIEALIVELFDAELLVEDAA